MTAILQRLHTFRRCSSGAVLVEFALVLPVLLLFLGTVVEGGRIAWIYQAASGSVRDASRMLARTTPVTPCEEGPSSGLTKMAVERVEASFPESIAQGRAFIEPVEVTVHCLSIDGLDGVTARVEVRATLEIELIFGQIFGIFASPVGPITTTITDQSRIYGL